MTDGESEIITLKREDQMDKENVNKPEHTSEPKIAFKRIVICPFPPEFGLMPDLMDQIMSHHENIINDDIQQKPKHHTHKTRHGPIVQIIENPIDDDNDNNNNNNNNQAVTHTNTNTTTTTNNTQFVTDTSAIKSLMFKYYALLACLIILITTASLICLKLKNIRAQVINTMKADHSSAYK